MALSGDLPEHSARRYTRIKHETGAVFQKPDNLLGEKEEPNREDKEEAREWKCPHCSYSVRLTYEELATVGRPMCMECEMEELELQD